MEGNKINEYPFPITPESLNFPEVEWLTKLSLPEIKQPII